MYRQYMLTLDLEIGRTDVQTVRADTGLESGRTNEQAARADIGPRIWTNSCTNSTTCNTNRCLTFSNNHPSKHGDQFPGQNRDIVNS